MEKESILKNDCILVDWFTCTFRGFDIPALIQLLGMVDCSWEECEHGLNGYPNRKYCGGVSILYGASERMGVCVSMSGSGCRYYETYGANDWPALLSLAVSSDDCNITRLDVACDDHSGLLDLDRLRVDTDLQNYVSRSRKWMIEYGSDGCSIYFGSRKSDILIRIYDKAAERGYDPESVHWIRVELQMRDTIASGFAAGILRDNICVEYFGVLRNYLRFLEPVEGDSNKSRWPTADYWENFLQSISSIRVWSTPGVEYNMANLENFVVNQAGSAIDTYIRTLGIQRLIFMIRNRDTVLSPKYRRLITEWENGGFPDDGISPSPDN